MNIPIVVKNDFPSLILELQDNDYSVVFCDCDENNEKCVNWIKVIKKMRPKVPLIVISKKIDKSIGGKLYQLGIFHLCEKPLNKDYLKEILSAILTPSKSYDKFNNFNNI